MICEKCKNRDGGHCLHPKMYEKSGNLNPQSGVYINCSPSFNECQFYRPNKGGTMKCQKCRIGIIPEEADKYDGLCFKCAVVEFDKRIMEEALAFGYGIEPDVAMGGSRG